MSEGLRGPDGSAPGDPASAPPPGAVPSAWNIANALTIARILLVPVFGWLLLTHGGDRPAYRYAAAFCFAVAMATDRIDGDLARSRGMVTDFGKVADPIADKALLGMAFVGLSVLGDIPWWVTILVLAREWGVTALRFVVIRHGVMPASRGGKLKTALQALALLLLVLPRWVWPLEPIWDAIADGVLVVAVLVTLVTGVDYLRRAVALRRSSSRTLAARAARERRRSGG